MVSGWQDIGGIHYYFSESGVLQTGWQEPDGLPRYFHEDGTPAQGWEYVDGERRYFLTDGLLATGWQVIDGMRCYLTQGGTAQTGWLETEEGRFYLNEQGIPIGGLAQLEGGTYYFYQGSGLMAQGLLDLEDGRYFFGEDGRKDVFDQHTEVLHLYVVLCGGGGGGADLIGNGIGLGILIKDDGRLPVFQSGSHIMHIAGEVFVHHQRAVVAPGADTLNGFLRVFHDDPVYALRLGDLLNNRAFYQRRVLL